MEREQVVGMGFLQSMRWTENTTDTTMMSKSPVSTSEESISDESSCSSEDEHGEQTTLRMATHREKEEVVHPCDPLNQSSRHRTRGASSKQSGDPHLIKKINRLKAKIRDMKLSRRDEVQFFADAFVETIPQTEERPRYRQPGAPDQLRRQDNWESIPQASVSLLKQRHDAELNDLEEVMEEQRQALNALQVEKVVLQETNKELQKELSRAANHGYIVQKSIENIQSQVKIIKARHEADRDAMKLKEQNFNAEQEKAYDLLRTFKTENERLRSMVDQIVHERRQRTQMLQNLEHENDRLKDRLVMEKAERRKREKAFQKAVALKISQLGDDRISAEEVVALLASLNRATPRSFS